jgi:type IX secretion system PorP/SprF family membrane protein
MKMLKNKIISGLITCILIFMCKSPAYSQQEPLYTQYMFNALSVNPAYTGTTNSLNLLALARYQWVGLKGAPKTFTFSMHAPIENKKMGLGFSVIQDEVGPTKNFYMSADYAYRVALSEKITLSLGLKAGIYNYYIGLTNLKLVDGTDASFQQDQQKKFNPNIGAGFYLYSDRWYAGLAVPTLIENAFDAKNQTVSSLSELKRHYYFIAGYVFHLNSDWAFKPSLVEKVVTGSPLSSDITAQFLYKEKYWIGTSYRIGDALAFLLDMKVTDQLMIGYSYDITLSKLSRYSNGTHEILLSFDFDRFVSKKVKSPRYF